MRVLLNESESVLKPDVGRTVSETVRILTTNLQYTPPTKPKPDDDIVESDEESDTYNA